MQAALTETWTTSLKPIQPESPAAIVSRILATELGDWASDYVVVDYCAGGGGPTPYIERFLNAQTAATPRKPKDDDDNNNKNNNNKLVHFVLTDLHPHIPNWALAASTSPQVHYAPASIDAANSPADLLTTVEPPLPPSLTNNITKTFRTFHLSFHHFPDPLARDILRNTMTTSNGFAIIELQDRHFTSFLALFLLGIGVVALAPYYAWRWRSFGTLFWSWAIPVLPFVLVWDGWMSSIRSRTADEIQGMMASCGVAEDEVRKWTLKSGRVTHLPPFAHVNWIIATKRDE